VHQNVTEGPFTWCIKTCSMLQESHMADR